MNYKRNKNGTFKSRSQWRKQQERKTLEGKYRLTMTLTSLVFALILGFAVQSDTYTIENTHVAQAYSPNLCELNYIDCGVKEESKVEKAIREIPHESVETEKWIRYIYEQAPKKDVDPDVVSHIIWCESGFWNKQSQLPYSFSSPKRGIHKGEQEKSYGILMWHVPDHDLTVEQALNPYFSIDRAIEYIGKGIFIWYGYSKETDTCANPVVEYWD